jgi:acyl-CoA thioesterase II
MATRKTSTVPPRTAPAGLTPLDELLALLDLEADDPTHLAPKFAGHNLKNGWGRVYGGQVLAQAIMAASRTVEADRPMHSMHAYFLLAGDTQQRIDYEVERLRDGSSFATRRVTALQAGQPIFAMMASFQRFEAGFMHTAPMPQVPPPEDIATLAAVLSRPEAKIPDNMRGYYAKPGPIEVRLVETERYFGGGAQPPRQHVWLKTVAPIESKAAALHTALLAYASDFALVDTALIPHSRIMFDPRLQLASLDHALWVHRPFRADQWLLYALDSPVANGGRGFSRGQFFDASGALVASVTQEGLMREKSTAYVIK